MDPNNNPFNSQNSSNYPFNYPNSNNYQFQNQSSSQPQNIPNYGFTPNFFMPSSVPNYPPFFGSMMPPQAHPYSSTTTSNKKFLNASENELEFSTQMSHGDMSGVNETTQDDVEDSPPVRRRGPKWTTAQNLVLLSGWIKYGTNSIVGKNQKSEAYWGKITNYCNEHGSFKSPCDGGSCRNHFNYINKILAKWSGAYDNAKRMKQSGWSDNDVLAKAHELYSTGKNGHFNLMAEWNAVRDQPRYLSLVGGNTGSGSSGSKRTHESDASDSNSVGSSARPMGRDAAKKKSKKKVREQLWNQWMKINKYQQLKEQEF